MDGRYIVGGVCVGQGRVFLFCVGMGGKRMWVGEICMVHGCRYVVSPARPHMKMPHTQAATNAASEVGLSPSLHAPASTLSGGQRRKLSVAMAFLGRSWCASVCAIKWSTPCCLEPWYIRCQRNGLGP